MVFHKRFRVLFFLPVFALSNGVAGESAASELQAIEDQLIYFANMQRVAHGLPILRRDPALSRAARIHSEYQAVNDILSHSEQSLTNPKDRIRKACEIEGGPDACMARLRGAAGVWTGENVLYSHKSLVIGAAHSAAPGPEAVAWHMTCMWMGSPGHRKNILKPDFNSIGGAAQFRVEGEKFYGTQVFASHARGSISSRDYSLASIPDAPQFTLAFVPGESLRAFRFRAVDAGRKPLPLVKSGEAWHLSSGGMQFPSTIRVEVEDDSFPGYFHPLCQFVIRREGDRLSWGWAPWPKL